MHTTQKLNELDVNLLLKLFKEDPDWVFKISVGGTLNAVWLVLLISNVLLAPLSIVFIAVNCGYVLRFISNRLNDRQCKLPDWNNWLELFMSGLTWLAILAGFYLVLFLVIFVSISIGEAFVFAKWSDNSVLIWALSSLLIAVITSAIISIITTFLVVNIVSTDKIDVKSGLFTTIRQIVAKPKDFILVWLLVIGLKWAAIIIPTISLVGVFIIPSTLFAADVLAAALIAQIWDK